MKRKLLSGFLATAMTMSLLVGCGSSAPAATETAEAPAAEAPAAEAPAAEAAEAPAAE